MKTLPIGIVEPHELLREGLNRILSKSRFKVVLECSCIEELWDVGAFGRELVAILLDVNEHGAMAPPDIERLRRVFPEAKIVLMSDPSQCRRAMEVGRDADGLMFRTSRTEVLIKSLELIVLGEPFFPIDVWREVAAAPPPAAPSPEKPLAGGHERERLLESAPDVPSPALRRACSDAFERLSEREIEVMRLLCRGDPNKIIARQLGISEATVKVHVKAILRKTQAKNRTEAALLMSGFAGQGTPH